MSNSKKPEVFLSVRMGINESVLYIGIIVRIDKSRHYYREVVREGPWWARTLYWLFHRLTVAVWLHPSTPSGLPHPLPKVIVTE